MLFRSLPKLQNDILAQEEFYRMTKKNLEDLKNSLIYEERIKSVKNVNISNCIIQRADKKIDTIPMLEDGDMIIGDYRVELYKGYKQSLEKLINDDKECLKRGGYIISDNYDGEVSETIHITRGK